MFTLYKFELKKVLSQKYFTIAFVFLYAFVMAVSVSPVITGSIDRVKQKDAITGRVLDDSLFKEFYANKDDDTYYDVEEFIKYCTNDADFSIELGESTIYESRLKQIEKEFENDYLTDDEKQYWLEKEAKLEKPFVYVRDDAYSEIYQVVYVVNFMILVLIAISITGIFADEKATGADQILLSSRYGRNKLFMAKVLSCLTIAFVITTVMYLSIIGINLLVYGSDGYNAALQIHMPTSLYSFSMGDSMYVMYIQLLLASFVYTTFALMLSILTKNHSASSGVMIVVMFLSMFNIPAKYRLISQIWDCIPSGHIGSWSLLKYQLINLFGIQLNSIEYSLIIWPMLVIIFVVISKKVYEKYEVESR